MQQTIFVPNLNTVVRKRKKDRKSIYIAPFIYYVYLKALRYGSHSFTCKYTTPFFLSFIHSFIHSFIVDQIKSDAFTVYRFRGTEQIKNYK